jgi:hypothetical protein
MNNGNLNVRSTLTTAGFQQSGGVLTGANLNVTNNFNQSGGSISLSGAALLTQLTGDLNIADLKAATVSLVSSSGRISQTGPIVASSLITDSVSGTKLNSANQVASYSATNHSTGDIELTNTAAPFTIASLTQSGTGNIVINNTGATITGSEYIVSGGSVTLVAHSPLTIGSGGVTANGNIELVASASDGTDNLVVNGPVASISGGIVLKAGDDCIIGTGIPVTAPLGSVTKITSAGTVIVDKIDTGAASQATSQIVTDTAVIDITPVTPTGLILVWRPQDEIDAGGNNRDEEVKDKDKDKNNQGQPPTSGDKKDANHKKKYCN